MQNIIQVENLVKSYGAVKAVKGVSFYAKAGTLFALLGENGAGKSTTIDMLATLLKPDAGRVQVCGCTVGRQDGDIRHKTGVVFQQSLLDGGLTVRENLLVRARLYGIKRPEAGSRIDTLCAPLGLEEIIDRRYGKLSGGQRRRADIARALLHRPQLLILDEPTTGLDPASRKAIWQTVRGLQQREGMSVLLTTHYMEEAAAADYVVVMGHGRVLAKGTAPQLKTEYAHDLLTLEASRPEDMRARLEGFGQSFVQTGSRFAVRLQSTPAALPLLNRLDKGIKSFEVVQGTLEDAFLRIIKQDKEAVA